MNHAPTRPTAQWVVRRGFVGGSPWPRAMAAVLVGLPLAVGLAWAMAWLQVWSPLWRALAALGLIGVLWGAAWLWRSLLASGDAAPVQLGWVGPLPGELAGPQAHADEGFAGFCVDGRPVALRCPLRWGAHLCLSWGPDGRRDWGWLQAASTPDALTLKVLLGLPVSRARAAAPMPEGREMLAAPVRSAQSVASCEAGASRPRRQTPRGRQREEEAFAPTEIMQEQQGMALESGRPHGPAGRRTER